MMKPEWKELAPGIFWCRGCGCIKIVREGKKTKYATPRREKLRRKMSRINPLFLSQKELIELNLEDMEDGT